MLNLTPGFTVGQEQPGQPQAAAERLNNFIPGAPNWPWREAHRPPEETQGFNWPACVNVPLASENVDPGIYLTPVKWSFGCYPTFSKRRQTGDYEDCGTGKQVLHRRVRYLQPPARMGLRTQERQSFCR
jgi:hypothetical protein